MYESLKNRIAALEEEEVLEEEEERRFGMFTPWGTKVEAHITLSRGGAQVCKGSRR